MYLNSPIHINPTYLIDIFKQLLTIICNFY